MIRYFRRIRKRRLFGLWMEGESWGPSLWERWRFRLSRDHRFGGFVFCPDSERLTEVTWLDPFSGYRITFTRGERWFSRWQEVRR